MPILIDDYTVSSLNGPERGVFLKKVSKNPAINNNYIILLGDQHSELGYKTCEDETCFELQTDFMYILNEFAKTTRTDFYLEKSHTIERVEKVIVPIQTQYLNLREDPQNSVIHAKSLKKSGYYPDSNMIEMRSMYQTCFIPQFKEKHCKYKNILWHSADPRLSKDKTSFYYHSNICHDSLGGLLKTGVPYSTRDLADVADDIYENTSLNVVDGLKYIKLLVTDSRAFIDALLQTRLFQKQYQKMNEQSQRLCKKRHFVKLLDFYKSWNGRPIKSQYENIIKRLDDMLLYFSSKSVKTRTEVLSRLNKENSLDIDPLEVNAFIGAITVISGVILDIYFILRINKQDGNRYGVGVGDEPNRKLVIGYFGTNHVMSLNHFFTNIIKTHKLQEDVGKDAEGNRRLEISRDIDLNTYFEHVIEETSSSKLRSFHKPRSSHKLRSKPWSSHKLRSKPRSSFNPLSFTFKSYPKSRPTFENNKTRKYQYR